MLGITFYVAAMAFSATMSAAGKWLATDYSVIQIIFFRVFFAFIPLVVLLKRDGKVHLATKRPDLQIVRGLCMLAAMFFFFPALSYLPLADAEAAFAMAPLFMTLFAMLFLGERLQKGTVGAIVLGLLGSLLILRPTEEMMRTEVLLPLIAAIFSAFTMIATRRLADTDTSSATFCWGNLIVLLGAASCLPVVWLTPTAMDMLVFVSMGVAGGLSTYCEIEACRHAPINRLAPFDYTILIWATMLGYALWGDFPDMWTWLGATAIVIGGLHVIAAAEAQQGKL